LTRNTRDPLTIATLSASPVYCLPAGGQPAGKLLRDTLIEISYIQ